MSAQQQDLQTMIAAAVAEAMAAMQATAAAPTAKATPAKAKATAAKATALVRNLDSITVPTEDDGVKWEVTPCYGQGGIRTAGAAIVPLVEGKRLRSLNRRSLSALAGEGIIERLAASIEAVDKRAQIGAHLVKPEKADA